MIDIGPSSEAVDYAAAYSAYLVRTPMVWIIQK